MRLNRFFIDRDNLRVGSSIKLEDSDIKHIRKVLRLSKGDKIIIFNGEKEFLAELKIVGNEVVMAEILEVTKVKDFSIQTTEVTIFQGLLRAGKIDSLIEKLTELGIDKIVPVECEFSQMKLDTAEKKIERWKKIAISAAKQSERIEVPEIYAPIKFQDVKTTLEQFDIVYFFTIPRKNIPSSEMTRSIRDSQKAGAKKIAFMVGPEGGFSPKEHELALQWGINFTKLESNVLRSETASVAIMSILKYIYD
jgi:16S rRNA (uracil1498-N3)-methyltransferase